MSEKKASNADKISGLINKALTDDKLRGRLLADTMSVLKEYGITVREGITIKAVEDTDKLYHLVIPGKPAGELSLEQLDKVAGGYGGFYW